MIWYYSAWSIYLRGVVNKLEAITPSRTESYNRLSEQTTVTTRVYWDEDQLIDHLVKYLQGKNLRKTGNLLDIMAGQRMGYDPVRLKKFIQHLWARVSKEVPDIKWETRRTSIFLTRE